MEAYTTFFIFIGVMIALGVVAYFVYKKPASNHNHDGQTQEVSRQYKPSEPAMPSRIPTPQQKVRVPTMEEQEARVRRLNALIESLVPLSKNQIWDLENIKDTVGEYLNDDDVQYIAKQLYTSLFATTVWDLHEKIKNCQLANDQIIKILESGTDNIIDTFMEYHTKSTTWTMSSLLLDKIISQNSLWIFRFTNYSKDVLMTIINRLSAYELLGYRMKPTTPDESIEDSFVDLQKSTDDNEISIEYYASADTDMVRFLEQYYPTETELRQKAFAKILAGSANIIATINRVDDLSDDEIKQIIARDYSAEIKELFEVCNVSSIANCFPSLYAIKVALQLVECDYEDELKENYDFSGIPMSTYQEVIASLSADELLGYDDRGNGNYDMIKLFEDNSIEDEAIRQLAFAKMSTSKHLADGIARWDNVTEEEVKVIMEKNEEDEVNALFGRDDSEDMICNLPEEVAIKIRLQLIYADSSETVENNYQFTDEKAFIKVIDELSANELLGFKLDSNNPAVFFNDAGYDIIKLIEDSMSDNDNLRKLAFTKMCESKDMSAAITRWDTVTEEEVKVIMERKNEEEIEALFNRQEESIIQSLPEELAIKIRLQLMYGDSSEAVENYYQFNDEKTFIAVINELSADELLGFKLDPNDPTSFCNDAEYDIIKCIEDEMGDNDKLRILAFAKMCESKDMSAAIARWDTVTEDEVKVIMVRKNEDEIEALFNRQEESIIENLPEDVAIKIRLQLIYPDASETVENNYQFNDEKACIAVINELSADELLGFKLDPNDPTSFYNDAAYDIISLIEDEMSDDDNLRKLAFAKICESKNMSDAIARWNTVTEEEVAKIIERGFEEEISSLLERDDSDDINAKLTDNFIIKQRLTGEDDSLHEEYDNRIDDAKYRQKVERMCKSLSSKKMTDDEKEGSVDDVSDDLLIKARLTLIDLDECSFDSDEVKSEYDYRRENNEEFKQKIDELATQIA